MFISFTAGTTDEMSELISVVAVSAHLSHALICCANSSIRHADSLISLETPLVDHPATFIRAATVIIWVTSGVESSRGLVISSTTETSHLTNAPIQEARRVIGSTTTLIWATAPIGPLTKGFIWSKEALLRAMAGPRQVVAGSMDLAAPFILLAGPIAHLTGVIIGSAGPALGVVNGLVYFARGPISSAGGSIYPVNSFQHLRRRAHTWMNACAKGEVTRASRMASRGPRSIALVAPLVQPPALENTGVYEKNETRCPLVALASE